MRNTVNALIVVVLLLVSLGIIALATTSSVRAATRFDDPSHYVRLQLIWVGVSLVLGYILSHIDYRLWQRLAPVLVIIVVILLAMVFLPGIGVRVGGSRRWLRVLGSVRLQPSEIAKIVEMIALSAWLAHVGRRATTFKYGLLMPGLGLSVLLGLVIAEPDFGTTMLMGATALIVLFAGGVRLHYLVITAAVGFSAFILAVMQDHVRWARVMAFLDPEKYPNTAYHLTQSKIAFILGGFSGVGLGDSIQKHYYLPESHTDFILAILAEEFGILGSGAVALLFGAILFLGLRISAYAPDRFGRLLAFGLTTMIVVQASINIGVVTGCLPTKGLPLPFISYGGSSMLSSIACICILINIGKQARIEPEGTRRAIKDRQHTF